MASEGQGNNSKKSFLKQIIRLKLQPLRNLFYEQESDRKTQPGKAAIQMDSRFNFQHIGYCFTNLKVDLLSPCLNSTI